MVASLRKDFQREQAIAEMKTPRNVQVLQNCLSLVSYLNSFRPKLAHMTGPVTALCKKGVVFAWESSQQDTYEAIEKEITSAPLMGDFD